MFNNSLRYSYSVSMLRKSLVISSTAICAVLYALGALATAYIPSPWGRGQFRPAVVIPAFFTTIFGPIVGGVGAALGTFIADSVKHGGPYMPSLVAAVPGNFAAFYFYGLLVRKFSWRRFIAASHLSLILGNFIVAFLYTTYVFGLLLPGLIVGLALWWYITMLPFILILTPILIRAATNAFPSLVSEEIKISSFSKEMPSREFAYSLLLPGALMTVLGGLLYVNPGILLFFFPGPLSRLIPIAGEILKVMFLATGLANIACGAFCTRLTSFR